jgi:hypothetical protein
LARFVAGIKHSSFRGLVKCEPILEAGFRQEFRLPHSQTSSIRDKEELYRLIRSGTAHRPAPARAGPAYNQEYLARKARYGEHSPHKFMNYGFWQGTEIEMRGYSLEMRTPPEIIRGTNYLALHERTRSVMKKGFLNAWQNIIDKLIENYAEEAQA